MVGGAGPFRALLTLGRRDFFVLAWFVMGALGLWKLVPLYAFIIALANGGVAVGQLLSRRPA